MRYNASETEKKWQKHWADQNLYRTNLKDSKKPKYYSLVMFPYPSGDKLHIGHWYNFAPADSHARFMRMKGFNVLEPMGFDAFGLPAENYAIKTGVHPTESIKKNVEHMIEQLHRMGCMYDWDKMVNTSTPEYYKWTQWVFLQMYKNGLAFRKKAPVNWCPSCKTVLANEQAQDGTCDRCDSVIVQKDLTQWFWKMSAYAQKLLDGHESLKGKWPDNTLLMQKNWIGRSDGFTYHQKIKDLGIQFEAYDSIPQTFMAQTFAVIAPEHPTLKELVKGTKYEKSVLKFVETIKQKKLANKYRTEQDMDGIFTGRYVENPFGTGDLPIWVASYVVMDYGSGIVNCSAHDERDFAFAKKFGIPLHPVMFPKDPKETVKIKNLEYCYHHDPNGIIQEPKEFKDRKWGEAREDILNYLEKKSMGKKTVNYKLRDWLISRQRYWGAPIPIVYCEGCGEVPIPEKDLPVLLPNNVEFKPTGDGKSPLASVPEFVKTKCPKCGGDAERETDTMDTFVCSSFYYLRYLDNKNEKELADKNMIKEWMPVDMYIGGPEHACMHLIYARFVMMALKDFGYVPYSEPFARLVHQGLITHKGAKMSKSKGNVVSPDEFVEKYGSDVFRMYLMFMGPFIEGAEWHNRGITGIARFVDRFYTLVTNPDGKDDDGILKLLHKTIVKVTDDIEVFHFNTAISALMEFVNTALAPGISKKSKEILIQLIAPMAPHLAEECYEHLGEKKSIFGSDWPKANKKWLVSETIRLVVQVNGRFRSTITVSPDISKEDALSLARKDPKILSFLAEKKEEKVIFVPGRLLNIVVN